MAKRRQARAAAGSGRRQTANQGLQTTMSAALAALQAGRLQAAEKLFRRVLKAIPEQPDALHWLGVSAHQQGDYARAARLIEKAVAGNDRQAVFHYHLGEAYRALGRAADAAASYRRAVALEPDVADIHFGLGNSLLDLDDAAGAEAAFHAALNRTPNDAEYLHGLGIALARQERWEEAVESYEIALMHAPDSAEIHYHLGLCREAQARSDAAIERYRAAIAADPEFEPAYGKLIRLSQRREDLDAAVELLQATVAAHPGSLPALLNLAKVLREQARYVEAVACYRRVLERAPERVDAHSNLGLCLAETGDHDGAMTHYRRALELDPGLAEVKFNIGVSLQNRGRFEDAIRWHKEALADRPGLAVAYDQLLSNKAYRPSADEVRRMEELFESGQLDDEQRIHLGFALGRLFEDGADYDRAFRFFQAANQEKSRGMGHDPAANSRHTDRLIATYTAEYFERTQGFGLDSRLPVLIVGMPRSGSTLVEQILASHPEVHGAGEVYHLTDLAQNAGTALGDPEDYPGSLARIDADTARALAADYLAALGAAAPEAARITDKMLSNYLRLGLLATLLPNAAIIDCRRDRFDTCVSCYLQNFAHGLRYTYDLGHLARLYLDYERLMAHWRAVLPLRILAVHYEELIADQAGVSRQIIEFCDLPWDDRVLEFHQTEREIRTASFWQARQPVYGSSVGRWRRYEAHLGPLFDLLGHPDGGAG